MIRTELSTLPEQLLDHVVVLLVPVNFGLRHQHWNVLLKAVIKLFQRFLNALIVLRQSRILDRFCQLTQVVNVPVCDNVQFA